MARPAQEATSQADAGGPGGTAYAMPPSRAPGANLAGFYFFALSRTSLLYWPHFSFARCAFSRSKISVGLNVSEV